MAAAQQLHLAAHHEGGIGAAGDDDHLVTPGAERFLGGAEDQQGFAGEGGGDEDALGGQAGDEGGGLGEGRAAPGREHPAQPKQDAEPLTKHPAAAWPAAPMSARSRRTTPKADE